MSDTPNPGSPEAVKMGCKCPVLDNAHGRGAYGLPGSFYYTAGCPVHWPVGSDLGPFTAVEEGGEERG